MVSIYLLILVGGVVRATGSGMGCPDWPKCFGQWVPPTDVKELPADYKQVYTAGRVAKNKKLARTLSSLGFKQVAGQIFAHPTQYIETDFNATKTWIEYINRLLGALIGVFVFVTAVVALPYWRRDKTVVVLAVGGWLLTGVQGWLGSLVVSTNLLPIMVTIHMGLALLIVAMLLYAADKAEHASLLTAKHEMPVLEKQSTLANSSGITTLLWLTLLMTFCQIIIGTQVREQIDQIASASGYLNRNQWVMKLGSVFSIHRSFSVLVVLLNGYAAYLLWHAAVRIRSLLSATLGLIALEVVAGLTLAYWGLPAAMQPVHLTVATLLFGTQFLTLVTWYRILAVQQTTQLRPAHA